MKKVPLRTCTVTKEKCEKKDLLRVVRMPDGKVVFDETGRLNGKGAYVKKDRDVILKAQKTKVLDRSLEVSISDSLYEELLSKVNND